MRHEFIQILHRLAEKAHDLLWEERVVDFAPEVSDFYVTYKDSPDLIISVRDDIDDARVIVDDYVFDSISIDEMYAFLSAVLDRDMEIVHPKGIWRQRQLVVRRGDQCWKS